MLGSLLWSFRWTGKPSSFSQRCTVRTSRRKWEAISFHELSRPAESFEIVLFSTMDVSRECTLSVANSNQIQLPGLDVADGAKKCDISGHATTALRQILSSLES
jgi:hypothetical protein